MKYNSNERKICVNAVQSEIMLKCVTGPQRTRNALIRGIWGYALWELNIPQVIAELIRDQGPVSLTFFIAIQIWWKFLFILTLIAIKFCIWYDSSAVVACAKIVTIWWSATELQRGKVSVEFKLWAKKSLVKRIPGLNMFQMCLWLMGRKRKHKSKYFFVHLYTIFCLSSR